MEIDFYFEPTDFTSGDFKKNSVGDKAVFFSHGSTFPDLEGVHMALIGVGEERGSHENFGCGNSPDAVRRHLYSLYHRDHEIKIADLGNIKPGAQLADTYAAVADVVAQLLESKVIPVILGGSQDLTFANYKGYAKLDQVVNLLVVDNKFDLGEPDDEINSSSFFSKIILHQPNYLFNFSNIGYQTYFVDKHAIELIDKLHFDAHRLGAVQSNIRLMEPVIRNADMVSIDVSAVRQSDAPGNLNASPNGLYGEELCQLTWFAGHSDKVTSIGFYEANPDFDMRNQTSHLVAQAIWHFIDGFYNRQHELPGRNKKGFIKYRVFMEDEEQELVFYKSKKSDRWWLDVPYPPHKGMKFERHHLVPCSYDDYQMACNMELPDIWVRTYQKLL